MDSSRQLFLGNNRSNASRTSKRSRGICTERTRFLPCVTLIGCRTSGWTGPLDTAVAQRQTVSGQSELSMIEGPYTRHEVLEACDAFPVRGPVCPKCRTHIPQFADLTTEHEATLRGLIDRGKKVEAMFKLREATGCSVRWSKIWVIHGGVPNNAAEAASPCPHCGAPLRSPRSTQCRFCKRDWHSGLVESLG